MQIGKKEYGIKGILVSNAIWPPDNEYELGDPDRASYFQDLVDVYRASEIDVPLTYNDFGKGRNFPNGTVRPCPVEVLTC